LIIRREISADGRNRVFINNQPTTVAALRELATSLLDIHGQHDQQTLLEPASQLTLVDIFTGTTISAETVRSLDAEIQSVRTELNELLIEHARKVERLDLLSFQHDEILKRIPDLGKRKNRAVNSMCCPIPASCSMLRPVATMCSTIRNLQASSMLDRPSAR
jgi:DNA repair protein RecN (Recombination protein N)